jgi:hypothetical protein
MKFFIMQYVVYMIQSIRNKKESFYKINFIKVKLFLKLGSKFMSKEYEIIQSFLRNFIQLKSFDCLWVILTIEKSYKGWYHS